MNDNLNSSEPLVLLIGSLNSEGITSTLKASGRQYKIKRLESSAENWDTIVNYFEEYTVRCAVVKLSGTTYEFLMAQSYRSVRDKILDQITKVPHAIFVYEELLMGRQSDSHSQTNDTSSDYLDDIRLYFHYPEDEVRNQVNSLIMNRGINLIPFTNNAELTVMASAFISDADEGLLFRFYVPVGRMWANETDRIVQLFRDYLIRVEKLSVRFDQYKTDRGIVYEFFSAADTSELVIRDDSLASQFQEFSHLLDLSMSNPAQAEEILRTKDIDRREIVPILTRYAKEAKRLQIDLKHEREQKVLAIRHRLESELIDSLPLGLDLDSIGQLVDSTVPPLLSINSAMSGNQVPLHLNAASGSSITVNLKPQFIQAVNSVIAQEIEGDIHLTETDRKLLELIRQNAPDREQELSSAVRELADASAPKPGRLIAKQKLKAFLIQAGSKAGEIGIGLLQKYLEGQMGL
jgi:hypothetical protein